MNRDNFVLKLDLAPKIKRPLSLWNPLDYLRLLYWVFFFPQAIQWYVDKFSNKDDFTNSKGQSDRFEELKPNFVSRRLFFQGFVTIAFLLLILLVVPTYHLATSNFVDSNEQTSFTKQNPVEPRSQKRFANKQDLELYNWLTEQSNFNKKLSFTEKVEIVYSSKSESWQWWLYILFYSLWIIVHIGILRPWKSIPHGLVFTILLGLQLCVSLWIGYLMRLGQIRENYFLHTIYISKAIFETALDDSFVLLGLFMGLVVGLIISISRSLERKVDLEPVTTLVIVLVTIVLKQYIDYNYILFWIAYLLSCYFLFFRLESWLASYLFSQKAIFNLNSIIISRVTSIPLPYISSNLESWLEQDWEMGVYNANQLVKYTLQFIPVTKAVNRVLAITADAHLIYRVSQLAANLYDWKLIHFASAPINRQVKPVDKNTRVDTPARATAAGFWHLHEKQPNKATEAFEKVRSLLYGEEVYILAKTLAIFHPVQKLEQIASLEIPVFPQDNLLRPITWKTLTNLRRVVKDIETIQNSVSRTTKALASNRAIGELTSTLNNSQTIPEAERELIVDIAQNWKQALESIAKDLGDISVTKPAINPYVIGDPVRGSLFAGREDIMRQLEELWQSDRLQSVVLYGHRRMGKTSILLNIDGNRKKIQIAYINLLRLGDSSQGVAEVLMQICDGIAEVTDIAPPDDDALLKLPYRAFERYIKQVGQANKGLIIAIDEFEKIEELIELRRIPADFLGFLRGIVQMNSKIALIFAGLHTLEEMTADYFQPFFASVIPIHVGFLNDASTRQILANPVDLTSSRSDEFILDYTPEALDLIYDLTAGQPYLVQLIGFQLVRFYNQEMFERNIVRDPIFSVEDVEKIIDRTFFQRGRYYFEGVWRQAALDVDGQQEIIKAIALHPHGISTEDLIASINLPKEVCLTTAISRLKRHDVIVQTDTGWRIVVELFRLWVINTQQLNVDLSDCP